MITLHDLTQSTRRQISTAAGHTRELLQPHRKLMTRVAAAGAVTAGIAYLTRRIPR